MAELTPLQIVRNMARNITSRRPSGSGLGAMGEINSLGQDIIAIILALKQKHDIGRVRHGEVLWQERQLKK